MGVLVLGVSAVAVILVDVRPVVVPMRLVCLGFVRAVLMPVPVLVSVLVSVMVVVVVLCHGLCASECRA